MKTREELLDAARRALEEVFADPSSTREETRGALETLRGDIDAHIVSLDDCAGVEDERGKDENRQRTP